MPIPEGMVDQGYRTPQSNRYFKSDFDYEVTDNPK